MIHQPLAFSLKKMCLNLNCNVFLVIWRMVSFWFPGLRRWARARNPGQTRSFTAREERFDLLSNLPAELTRILLWQLICFCRLKWIFYSWNAAIEPDGGLLRKTKDVSFWSDGICSLLFCLCNCSLWCHFLCPLFEFTYFLKVYACAYVLLN